jgi:hypothetical protein
LSPVRQLAEIKQQVLPVPRQKPIAAIVALRGHANVNRQFSGEAGNRAYVT